MNATPSQISTPLAPCGYQVTKKLGEGTYAQVYLVNLNGSLFAMKLIPTSESTLGLDTTTIVELDIMSRLHHPHLVQLRELLTEQRCGLRGLGMVIDLAPMVLTEVIASLGITYADRVKFMFQIASTIRFLHQNGYLHLDIKDANILLTGNIGYTELNALVTDFGLALKVDDVRTGRNNHRVRITPDYRSPELLDPITLVSTPYTEKADVWSLGILFLQLLSGRHLFTVFTNEEILATIRTKLGDDRIATLTSFLTLVPPHEQKSAVDLLDKMLQLDPTSRATMDQVLSSAFFQHRGYVTPIGGDVMVPERVGSELFQSAHLSYIQWMIEVVTKYFSPYRAEVLFLLVDLLYRVYPSVPLTQPELILYGLVCLWISAKLIGYDDLTSAYLAQFSSGLVSSEQLVRTEMIVLDFLQGQIYRSNLYSTVQTAQQLARAYDVLVLGDQYYSFDVTTWMTQQPQDTTPYQKDITIDQLMMLRTQLKNNEK